MSGAERSERASERSAAEQTSEQTSGLFKNDAVFCKIGHSAIIEHDKEATAVKSHMAILLKDVEYQFAL